VPPGRQLARDYYIAAGLVSHLPEFTAALRRFRSIGKCRADLFHKWDLVPGLGSEGVQMYLTSVARRTGQGLVVLAFSLAAVSMTLPGTAYARHNNGAAIALGILGGALAGAAISAGAAPGYYSAAPAYYYPYAPPAYSVAPAPAYYYAPPAAPYYAPVPYYGQQYYGSQYYYSGY
jgi:hypothetical protein